MDDTLANFNSSDAARTRWTQAAVSILQRVRDTAPRVHCITNEVAVSYSANALLAIGAIPSMTWQATEVSDFVGTARGLVINLGTLDEGRESGIRQAIASANQHSVPWILDPVFIERSPGRLKFARGLLRDNPTVVRANQAEHDALGTTGSWVSVVSGAVDTISAGEPTGERRISLENGHPMMTQVTATGCAASALLGACVAVSKDPFEGAVAATMILGVAGEIAAASANGPGSLQFTLLDSLSNLTSEQIQSRAKIS